ncbi:MAG: hypothetical protein ACRDRZ_18310 [Pseudonocardiaceae bacterium]
MIDAALRERMQAPVTLADRVLAAAGALIAAEGVGALTLERVAGQAGCTVMSVYNQIGGRDALLVAVFARHTVLPQLTPLLDTGAAPSVEEIAATVYRHLLDIGLGRGRGDRPDGRGDRPPGLDPGRASRCRRSAG